MIGLVSLVLGPTRAGSVICVCVHAFIVLAQGLVCARRTQNRPAGGGCERLFIKGDWLLILATKKGPLITASSILNYKCFFRYK